MFFKEKHALEAQSRERQKAEQVAQFLKEMLEGVGPAVALGRDTTMLREILDKTAERIGQGLKDQPEVEADLRSLIGEVYVALGEYAKAEEMHRAALAKFRTVLGNEHRSVANSLHRLANVVNLRGRPAG